MNNLFEPKRKPSYNVSCEARPVGASKFVPHFLIYEGAIGNSSLVHAAQPPVDAPQFDTAVEAMHAAVDLAVAYMDRKLTA